MPASHSQFRSNSLIPLFRQIALEKHLINSKKYSVPWKQADE